jgi:hypothetical protein
MPQANSAQASLGDQVAVFTDLETWPCSTPWRR